MLAAILSYSDSRNLLDKEHREGILKVACSYLFEKYIKLLRMVLELEKVTDMLTVVEASSTSP